MSAHCPRCGVRLADTAKRCPRCGIRMPGSRISLPSAWAASSAGGDKPASPSPCFLLSRLTPPRERGLLAEHRITGSFQCCALERARPGAQQQAIGSPA